jgi:hypothetical protein
MIQFVFAPTDGWLTGHHPCGLRKAVKQATGTTCFVYENGQLIKTLDVEELFEWYLIKLGYSQHNILWDRPAWKLLQIRNSMKVKQDQNNKFLQKIRKLI